MDTFNWKKYLSNYPDLQKAGINDKLSAFRHYNNFGRNEGRIDKWTNGINNVDIVYFINLEHRKDRHDHIIHELKKMGIESKRINKIDAIYDPDLGIRGCTASHCKTLEMFINSPYNNCIIFEDDFTFTQDIETVNDKFNSFFNSKYLDNFHLVMLAGSTKTEVTLENFLTKVYHSQTTSGYLISKDFAPALLENFRETDMLDVNWLKLQPESNWYSFKPRLGLQMESYSDITHKLENYRL